MNLQNLLKQAQQMQATVAKVEKELNETVYTGSAGGDAVKVEIRGDYQITSISINDELVDKDSKDMLQELVMLAVNNATEQATADRDQKMGAVTQGVKIPGMF